MHYGYLIIANEPFKLLTGALAFVILWVYYKKYYKEIKRCYKNRNIFRFFENHPDIFIISLILLIFWPYFRINVFFISFYIIFKILWGYFIKFKIVDFLNDYPYLFLIFTFIIVIIIGSYLLTLPIMSKSGHINFIDALFTATSATCVTGLIVVDTAIFFTFWGKLLIIILIQIGGLGFMTISTFLLLALGRKLSIKDIGLLSEIYNIENLRGIYFIFKKIILYTFFFESLGAIVLYIRSFSYSQIHDKIFFAIFHSVSAFCNAGFALQSDSLVSFGTDVVVNITIMFLIITGGIGFTVIGNLFDFSLNKNRISEHSKLVLITTAILIAIGSILFFFTEFDSSLKDLEFGDKIMASIFQSVTLRTAGFNTVDFSLLSPLIKFIMLFFMFIGGGSSSTAGGIKITTVVVIVLYVFSILRNRMNVTIFKKEINKAIIDKSIAILVLSLFIIFISFSGLLFFEDISNLKFEDLLFETFSAFGTVGLSCGITPYLNTIGKVIIILLMFIGRVGPLSFAFVIRKKNSREFNISYPTANILIG